MKLCPRCDEPLGADGRCEHWEDHLWSQLNAESLESDTRHLWETR